MSSTNTPSPAPRRRRRRRPWGRVGLRMKLAEGIEGQLTHHSHTAFKLQGRKGEGEVYVVFGLDSAGSVVRATVESPKAEDVTFEYTTKLFLEDLDRRHEARKARFEQLRKRLEELEKKYD